MAQLDAPFPYDPTSSEIPRERTLLFATDAGSQVMAIAESIRQLNGVDFNGSWVSPTLSRQSSGQEMTLRTLGFMYSAEAATSFLVDVSGDGGDSFTEQKEIFVEATGKDVKRIRQSFNTSGYDLRFKITFTPLTIVKLFSYYPSLIQRGRTVL